MTFVPCVEPLQRKLNNVQLLSACFEDSYKGNNQRNKVLRNYKRKKETVDGTEMAVVEYDVATQMNEWTFILLCLPFFPIFF